MSEVDERVPQPVACGEFRQYRFKQKSASSQWSEWRDGSLSDWAKIQSGWHVEERIKPSLFSHPRQLRREG